MHPSTLSDTFPLQWSEITHFKIKHYLGRRFTKNICKHCQQLEENCVTIVEGDVVGVDEATAVGNPAFRIGDEEEDEIPMIR